MSAFVPVKIHHESSTTFICRSSSRQSAEVEIKTETYTCSEFLTYCNCMVENQTCNEINQRKLKSLFGRPQLIQWLFDMTNYLRLDIKISFQSLHLVNCYLNKVAVSSDQLGLIFVTSFFTTCKLNNIGIYVQQIIQLTNNKFKRDDIVSMQMKIVTTLGCDLNTPNAYDFLSMLWEGCGYLNESKDSSSGSVTVEQTPMSSPHNTPMFTEFPVDNSVYTKTIIDTSLTFLKMMTFDDNYLNDRPASTAAAALYLARDFCHCSNLWEDKLQSCLHLTQEDVKMITRDFLPMMRRVVMTNEGNGINSITNFKQMILNHMQGRTLFTCQEKPCCFWHSQMFHID